MEIGIWIVVILLFLASFIGLLFPIIPSVAVIWGGFLLYHFAINRDELSVIFWIAMIIFTVIIIAADIIANSYFVKKYGGTKWGERIAAIGTIVGSFIYPPFGIIFIPLVAVFIAEYVQHKDVKLAASVGYASLIGFLSSTFAKGILLMVMVAFFLLDVFIF